MHDVFALARQHAAQMREYYEAYLSVGFTEEEALEMVLVLLEGLTRTN